MSRGRTTCLLGTGVVILSMFLAVPLANGQWTSVGNGIDYQEFLISGPNKLFVARMAIANTNAYIESSIAQATISGGLETTSAQSARLDDAIGYWGQTWGNRNDVVVAINGSFIEPSGAPQSGQVHSAWYCKRFDNVSGGSGFAWNLNRFPFIGECVTHYAEKQIITYANSNTQQFQGINVVPNDGQLTIYTPQYNTSTGTDNTVTEVVVQMSRPALLMPLPNMATGTVLEIRQNQGNSRIPFDCVVLCAQGSAETTLLSNVQVGDTIGISQEIKSLDSSCATAIPLDWTKTYASISGNWVFLKNNVIQYGIDPDNLVHPRTAIAYNETYVFFIVNDGRQPGYSVGMTIDALAEFCKNTLGATWGVNQDGGGSSTMVVNGVIKNSPSDGSERAIANGMMMCNILAKTQSATFTSGQNVQTSASATVRLGPGTNYGSITTVASGTQGTVVSHNLNGVYAKGYYWWKVSFPTVTGWVAESLLGGASCTAPAITQQPATQSVSTGQNASFTVAASGTAPLSYQWQKNQVNLADGGNISGATTATLQVSNCQSTDAGNYRCIVTNACGNATSNEATLTVTTGGTQFCFTNNDMESFTSGVATGWTACGSPATFSSSTDAYSGTYSQQILWTGSGTLLSAIYQRVWVQVGVPYTVSAYFVMSDSTHLNGTIRVDYNGGTDPTVFDLMWSAPRDVWGIKTATFTKTTGVDGWATIFVGGYGSAIQANDWCRVDLVTPACTGGGPTTCQVDSIVLAEVNAGGTNRRARATVTIKDNLGNPVSNATVTGNFTGKINETRSGVTDVNGVTVIDTVGTAKRPLTFTFCVTNVTHASLTYNSSANVETCDSY